MSAPAPPELDEKPVPLWQKLTALAAAVLLVAALAIWHDRLAADFWPPDASRIAPNLVASVIQWAVVLTIAALIWPPTRRRIHRYITSHVAPLHERFDRLHAQREAQHEEQMAAAAENRRRLDHIIEHHPEIPPLPPL